MKKLLMICAILFAAVGFCQDNSNNDFLTAAERTWRDNWQDNHGSDLTAAERTWVDNWVDNIYKHKTSSGNMPLRRNTSDYDRTTNLKNLRQQILGNRNKRERSGLSGIIELIGRYPIPALIFFVFALSILGWARWINRNYEPSREQIDVAICLLIGLLVSALIGGLLDRAAENNRDEARNTPSQTETH